MAYAILSIYAVLVVAMLPGDAYPLMFFGLAALVSAVLVADRIWGARETHGMTVMAVSFVGAAVLVVPNFPAMGGGHRAAVPLGFVGSQGVALLWITSRWTPEQKRKERSSLGRCLGGGALAALGLSAIATIPIAIMLLSEPQKAASVLWVYPAYLAGATTAALFYWLLQGVSHRPIGKYAIGLLGGMCMYAAVGPVASAMKDQPMSVTEFLMVGLVLGVLVGPPVVIEAGRGDAR